MRATRWTFIALLLTVWGFALATSGEASAQSYDAEEARFLELINAYRQENGLEPLLLSAPLSVAAERHSEDMGTYGFFSHTSVQSSYYPAGSGHVERIVQEGYDYNTYTSENVAWGQATAEEVFEAWRVSPGHNTNMLGAYKVIGIGLVTTNGTPYWTTDFGAYVDPSAGGSGGGDTTSDGTAVSSEDVPVERLATPDATDGGAGATAQGGADDAQYAGTDDEQYADDDQYAAGGTDDEQYAAPVASDAAADAPQAAPETASADAADEASTSAATDRGTFDDVNDAEDGSNASTGTAASAGSAAASMGMTTLPDTGGPSPMLLAASILLPFGGLLVRRFS
jgi:uncharacterized protein YkwD